MNKKNFKNFDFCSQVSAFLIENCSMPDASAFAVFLTGPVAAEKSAYIHPQRLTHNCLALKFLCTHN